MSVEEKIREKQRFEYRLKEFLKFASALSNEEIEIVLGRLADKMTNSDDDFQKKHIKFTGDILKFYYDLRISGKKKKASFEG